MNTYNDLFNKILNEYQIEQKPSQVKNPIIDNLMNYLKTTGMDTSNINPTDLETILNSKQEEENENDNTQQQNTIQNTQNSTIKSNVVSNIPVNNLTSFQNKNIQKKI